MTDYDRRQAGSDSFVTRKLKQSFVDMESELLKKLKNYSHGKLTKVAVVVRGPGMIRISLWIHLPPDKKEGDPLYVYPPDNDRYVHPSSDYADIAKILLGDGFAIGPHAGVAYLHIAGRDYHV